MIKMMGRVWGVALALVLVAGPAYASTGDSFEPDDAVAQAKPLDLGVPQARTLSPVGDSDWVSLAVVAGQDYVVTAVNSSPAYTDTVLELYASDGLTLLKTDDDSAGFNGARIGWRSSVTGTMYARVRGYHSGVTGPYTLSFARAGSATGRVTDVKTGAGVSGIQVELYEYIEQADDGIVIGAWEIVATQMTPASGVFRFDGVPAGTRRIGYYDPVGAYAEQYFQGSRSVAGATNVTITAGSTAQNLNAALARVPTIYTTVAGATRVETAVQASKLAFPGTARAVIVATARDWPDALGGSALAGAIGAPILLTDPHSLPAAVMQEVQRLAPEEVLVLGGPGAVSQAVVAELGALPAKPAVRRIWGADRYDTSNAVAREFAARMGDEFEGSFFLATGRSFPDALAASPIAAYSGLPILLSDTAALRASTLSAIREIGGSKAVLLGGEGALGAGVAQGLKAELGSSNVSRLSGADRYSTAAAVATWGVTSQGMRWNNVAIATGEDFPDALAGGVAQGAVGSVLLLSKRQTLSPAAEERLVSEVRQIRRVRYYGGALSVVLKDRVKQVLF